MLSVHLQEKKNDNKITKSKIRLKNKIINLIIHLMSTILLAWYFFTSNDELGLNSMMILFHTINHFRLAYSCGKEIPQKILKMNKVLDVLLYLFGFRKGDN